MGILEQILGAPSQNRGIVAGLQEPPELENSHGGSFMTGLINAIASALTLPRDVYEGKVDPRSEEGIQRANDMAGIVTLGAGAVPAEANSLRAGIKAYHGSPHDFDRFDLSKIGTGEGAQAYGHGLYFAENEGVAKSYRDALSMRNMADGSKVDWDDPGSVAAAWVRIKGDPQAAIAHLRSIKPEHGADNYRVSQSAAEMLERGDALPGFSPGSMYEVQINAEPDHFLDWDRPLAEQPEVLRRLRGGKYDDDIAALEAERPKVEAPEFNGSIEDFFAGVTADVEKKSADISAKQTRAEKAKAKLAEMLKFYDESVPGGYIAQDIAKKPGGAELLRDAGIPGIKYLDRGSRGAGDGSRNYVVFDDKIVDILRKYGVASFAALPPAVQAAIALGQQPEGE